MCCPVIYISLYTHTHLSPCVVYFLLLLFSLSLPFLNLFTSLSIQPDGGVFIFIFSIAKAHRQQQHKYEHRSLIESMRSHSSILSFWIHKPDSLCWLPSSQSCQSWCDIAVGSLAHRWYDRNLYWLHCGMLPFTFCPPFHFLFYLSFETDFPAPSLKAFRLLVSSFNLLRLFSTSVRSFTLKIATTSLYLLWGSLICLEFSQTSLLAEFQHLSCDAGFFGSLFLAYLFPILLLSLCVGIFLSAQPGLHLCCCCRPIISLKVVPSQKHIWTLSPLFVCRSWIQPGQLGFEAFLLKKLHNWMQSNPTHL